ADGTAAAGAPAAVGGEADVAAQQRAAPNAVEDDPLSFYLGLGAKPQVARCFVEVMRRHGVDRVADIERSDKTARAIGAGYDDCFAAA
ncbi:MAG: hypothetical protein ACKVWR_07615, partial [Acidimicrobiales bacterium]